MNTDIRLSVIFFHSLKDGEIRTPVRARPRGLAPSPMAEDSANSAHMGKPVNIFFDKN